MVAKAILSRKVHIAKKHLRNNVVKVNKCKKEEKHFLAVKMKN